MKAATAEIVAGRPVVLDLRPSPPERPARLPAVIEGYPCPSCGQMRVRRSRAKSNLGLCLSLFFVARYRCHGCYRVFWAPAPMMWLVDG